MNPKFVTCHLQSGDFPAIVTRDNGDDTLNVMIFTDGGVVNRMGVKRYVEDVDDVPEDKYGFYSE